VTALPWRVIADRYDHDAADYDVRHGDRRSVVRARVVDRVLLAGIGGATRVLEIGVGTGRLLAQVRAPVRVGIDIAAGMLAQAAARGLIVARADGHQLPFADETFDAVIAGKGSLRYLDPARALAEAARVLRPGGALAFHLYGGAVWSPRRAPPASDGLWQPRSTQDLRLTLSAAGFADVQLARFRTVRVSPYMLAIPEWLDSRSPVQLWSHVAVVTRRR
jgi:SAM-dependent methyltransferase